MNDTFEYFVIVWVFRIVVMPSDSKVGYLKGISFQKVRHQGSH